MYCLLDTEEQKVGSENMLSVQLKDAEHLSVEINITSKVMIPIKFPPSTFDKID